MTERSVDGSHTAGGNVRTLFQWLLVGIGVVLLIAGLAFVWWFSTGVERSRNLLATATLRVVDPAGAPVAGVPVDVKWTSWRGF